MIPILFSDMGDAIAPSIKMGDIDCPKTIYHRNELTDIAIGCVQMIDITSENIGCDLNG